MTTRYHLTPDITPLFIDDGTVFEAADGFMVTRDAVTRLLVATLAQGARSRQELADDLEPDVSVRTLQDTLDALVAADIALELPTSLTPTASALWRTVGAPPHEAAVAIDVTSVAVEATGTARAMLGDALAEWGLRASESPGAAVRVVVCADPLDSTLRRRNAEALQAGTPWLLIAPTVDGAWMTLFVPGRTACWECLAARLHYNRPARTLDNPRRTAPVTLRGTTAHAVARYVATFANRRELPDLERQWVHMEAGAAKPEFAHPCDRLPHCPACGTEPPAGTPLDRPPTPQPEYRRLLSPVTGVARDLHHRSMGGVFVAAVHHRFPGGARSLSHLMNVEHQVAGGRGWSPEAAARRAVFEAVERISGCYRPALLTREASADELGDKALLPADIDGYSDTQRSHPTPSGSLSMLTVPHAFSASRQTAWVKAWPLGHDGDARWFPAAAAFYGFPFEGERFAFATSNGCAAGPTVREAVMGGLLELIERDAAAIWWYNRVPRPALDIDALDDRRIAQMREALDTEGRSFTLLDLTTDLGVPVVVAVSHRAEGLPGWTLGFGAAPDYLKAVRRATGELSQLLAATDSPTLHNPAPWVDTATVAENPHLVPNGEVVPPRTEGPRSLEALAQLLAAAGLESYLIDQTHPLIGVPVVRVLAPGLVHFWRRLGASRLYEVPVRMGWRSQATAEHDMNPLDLTL